MTTPYPSQADAARAVLAGLDPEQRQVATTIGGPVAVIAGAGTGKTRAITHRIAYAALTGQQDPRAVLAVTFTTRAAGELRARLASLGVGRVQARTFHAAALRQLRYFWPKVHGGNLPELTSSTFAMVAEAARAEHLQPDTALLRDLAGEISWAKVTNTTTAEYPALARAFGRTVNGVDPEQVARVAVRYEQVKRRRAVMDYDDILLAMVGLLHDEPEVTAELRGGYRHFVVDEFQDLSPLQFSLLQLWLGDSQDLCVVGDPQQSIHSFAGADAGFLTGFTHRFPQATVLHLDRNYRSGTEIIATANKLLQTADGQTVRLRAQREVPGQVEACAAVDETIEAHQVAQWLQGIHDQGTPWSQMAVLFRVNAQAPALEVAFSDLDIPYVVRGSERFYERPIIRRALDRLARAAESHPDLPAREGLLGVLGELGWTEQAPAGQGAVREQWESLTALRDAALEIETELTSPARSAPDAGLAVVELTVADLNQRVQLQATLQHAPQVTGVTLATLHSAKGLEWSAVALIGIHEQMMPFVLASTPAAVAEERRLFYVGVTRARDQLRISWSESGPGGRGHHRPSRFLAEAIDLDQAWSGASRRRRRPARSAHSRDCRVCGGTLIDPAEIKLGRHLGCPFDYDEELLERLKAWRLETARAASVPAYVVFTDATLQAICEAKPSNRSGLLKVSGVGLVKVDRYGPDVLRLLNNPSSGDNI